MVLTLEQLRAAAWGAVYLTQEDGTVCFHRFSAEQEEQYRLYSEEFWKKTFATAGVRLCFRTDSPWMDLEIQALQTMPRTYYALDVAVNDTRIGSIDNVSGLELPEDYTTITCELGSFAKRFSLGEGVKTVTISFPWTADLRVKALKLAEGAAFSPVHRPKKLLAFGDSITQGYDALHPDRRYAALLADALDAEEINKAIGGEVFYPPLAETAEEMDPDYIIVAYGTNDWSKLERPELLRHTHMFLETLRQKYPDAKLFVLLPIWRKDRDEYRKYGSFDLMRADLAQVAGELGLPVIDCYDFVPKDPSYFADLRLHPNDRGFEAYAAQLANAIARVSEGET